MAFHPYLAFAGNCREAFTRYQEVFGGELVLLPLGEMPADDGPPPEGMGADQIGHAALMVGDELLMGADAPAGALDGGVRGICVNRSMASQDEAARVFDALAEGGEVQMPLTPTFFSPAFGMCTDRFGIPWMLMVEDPNASGMPTT